MTAITISHDYTRALLTGLDRINDATTLDGAHYELRKVLNLVEQLRPLTEGGAS